MHFIFFLDTPEQNVLFLAESLNSTDILKSACNKHIGITINHANCTHQIVKYNYASFSFNHKTVMEGVGRFIYNR